MSEVYIGTDLVEVNRIKSSIKNIGNRFIERIFTLKEQKYCSSKFDPNIHYAGRFAAKEAIMKALKSSGYRKAISFLSIEIEHLKSGEPNAVLHFLHEGNCKVSISHTKFHAIAFSVYTF